MRHGAGAERLEVGAALEGGHNPPAGPALRDCALAYDAMCTMKPKFT